ncbi:hypothetical protein HID58_092243 [Brassica napus]|uniref:Uncharacterized protein n=2 Tax=Brassica napus TaxID=3708 RepID=A0ABQ7WX68_BRANA|nr:hypothetical protein HID58_092243 [Brassica napus]CDY37823.1 BnaAnng04840D [Brassica napus]
MTLSVEDHREGRCFVAGYEIRRNEAWFDSSDGVPRQRRSGRDGVRRVSIRWRRCFHVFSSQSPRRV